MFLTALRSMHAAEQSNICDFMAGYQEDLLELEGREEGHGEKNASEAGTATDSDDSLEPYDLNEDHEEGMLF